MTLRTTIRKRDGLRVYAGTIQAGAWASSSWSSSFRPPCVEGDMLPSGYEDTARSLLTRFRKVAEEHPQEVRDIDSAFDMFKLGLDVGDLQPSLGQANACLAIVQKELREADDE